MPRGERPPRLTEKPVIAGIQIATAVGPHGEEIFCQVWAHQRAVPLGPGGHEGSGQFLLDAGFVGMGGQAVGAFFRSCRP
jgi:hypothetical protein